MTAEVDAKSSAILPGSMGSATLTLASLEHAVTVPVTALHTADDGSRFVKTEDGTNTPVTLAAVDGKNAILSSGPANGTKVIVP